MSTNKWMVNVMDMFIILMVVLVLQMYTYAKTYQMARFKYVQFIAWQ